MVAVKKGDTAGDESAIPKKGPQVKQQRACEIVRNSSVKNVFLKCFILNDSQDDLIIVIGPENLLIRLIKITNKTTVDIELLLEEAKLLPKIKVHQVRRFNSFIFYRDFIVQRNYGS